ncbi:hypothetical protein JJQ59_37615 (plasmid) [Cupriavidus necator]|uniref:Uncharacterized protein n=1 Tax=Cupriavidus necator TaxID=106590 RepID=A0A367P6Z4_CUPNE|nr:hypothetical protein [Cupriavidus necator]QQX89271.1 hypothetical protein JJQ59_37615 [Cupriavidus necator]RCJ03618.1 hypothetical protein DDK22_36305 [Cupriavidus necator]
MPLTPEQLQRLLDEPIDSWDVCNLLSGTVDFLEFSESNLAWQRRRELQRAQERVHVPVREAPFVTSFRQAKR